MAAEGRNVDGVRLYQQGQYQAAMERFQKALNADPHNADAYYNMAATFHRLGAAGNDQYQLGQAENLYNQSLDLDPAHTDCYRGLAVLLRDTGRQDRAFKLLTNWAVANPKSADARIELARLYQETGDKETAGLHLQEALRIDKHSSRAWTALARLREESGDFSQALANYKRSYQLNRLQPAVAERIAALNRSFGGLIDTGAPSDTRTVNVGGASPRY
jgi:Tfp pilus assembly protein PilF